MTSGREPVQIVEIKQPYCANAFGVAPCTASGGADAKCYNTYGTCGDQANFNKTELSLFFSRGNVGEQAFEDVDYIIPSLTGVSTAPSRINLAGMNPDASGLGNRAMARLTFKDHPHTDRVVDPYIDGRSWEGLDKGSFWTKWLARNKYRANIPVIVYEGYFSDPVLAVDDDTVLLLEDGDLLLTGLRASLSDMVKREYILQGVQGPTATGQVVLEAKDILAKVEERKAQAPALSPGRLAASISASDTSFEVSNASVSDYSATGTLRIDGEVMTYSARAASGDNVAFTISARGKDGTTAATHDADALVQECLRFSSQSVDQIASTLLQTYAGIDASDLDAANWTTEVSSYLAAFTFSTLITEPVSVGQLMSELQIEAGCFFWWDERAGLVKMKAVRGLDSEPDLLTDSEHIIAGSFSLREHPQRRISQCWLYYGRRDPTEALGKTSNFESALIQADLAAEGANEYDESQIKQVRCRFLESEAQSLSTGSKLLVRFRDTPRQAVFDLDAKDRTYWTGDTVRVSHPLDVDEFGDRNIANWTVTDAEEIEPGHRIRLTCEDTTLYGKIAFILADGHADYQGDGSDPFNGCFIGDANGLLSDGTSCARIT